jgi:hypothetical protein
MQDLRTWPNWHAIHQPFELNWWREHLRDHPLAFDDEGFAAFWNEVAAFIKPHGAIIDIGCGPRPPFPGTVIEPLALQYQKLERVKPEWWADIKAYAQPAEELVPDLRGDTIICWNCIDHAIGWREILDNMLAYGNPGARFAIATDFHAPFVGHPGFPREEFMAEIGKRFTIIDSREPFGRHLALLMTA